MKKIFLAAIFALSIGCYQGAANAAVLGFDDVTTDPYETVFDGYGGLTWSYANTDTVAMSTYGFGWPGLTEGIVSGNYAAVTNNPGANASFVITSSSLFNFNSAYFNSLYIPQNIINIEGYLGGVLQNQYSFGVSNTTPVFYEASGLFSGIDKLVISSGVTAQTWDLYEVNYIVMDNFDFGPPSGSTSDTTPTPEPSSMLLGLMGLGSIFGLKRKK